MYAEEFNALSLQERSELVFNNGKLVCIAKEYTVLKEFIYELYSLRINVIYDKLQKKLVDVKALGDVPEKRIYRKGA